MDGQVGSGVRAAPIGTGRLPCFARYVFSTVVTRMRVCPPTSARSGVSA